jgi:large subunit ribosomal protein L6
MHEDLIEKIEIPENVEVSIDGGISIKGPKGTLKREFPISMRKDGNFIILEAKNATKNKKKLIKTARAHINNMIRGVIEGYEYLLQICSVHFPITVTADKETITIKNFLGETTPRKAKIVPGVQVKIEGDIIKLSSPNIESAGQTAANLETATKIRKRDRSRFQDGIWIINKAGEEM